MASTSSEEQQPSTESSQSPLEGTLLECMPIQSEKLEDDSKLLYLDMEPLNHIANGGTIRIPRNPHFTRKDVVHAFQTAFELVGGVPRLALWANDNYTEFTKLYARLLPSQSANALGESNKLVIEMRIPHSPLDDQEVPEERK